MASQFVPIDDLAHPALDPYRELQRTNLTRWSGQFIVEGRTLVERLCASRFPVVSVLVSERYVEQLPSELSHDTPVFVVAHRVVDELIGFNFHRGMLACGQRLPNVPLAELVERRGSESLWCICPHILDPTNLGSIIRNAAALGVQAVVLGPQSADPFSRRCLRVSMGTVLRIPVVQSADLVADLHWLAATAQLELWATVLEPAAERLPSIDRAAHAAILLGPEGPGLGAEWVQLCARRVTLPMAWETDSLNVASASAVFLYHFQHLAPRR